MNDVDRMFQEIAKILNNIIDTNKLMNQRLDIIETTIKRINKEARESNARDS